MPIEWWVSLILALFAICVSPGNGAIISMRYGLKGGVSYAWPVIFGLQCGLLGVYAVILTSLMLATKISNQLIDSIALIGGAYLFYLGGRDIYGARNLKNNSKFLVQLENKNIYKESFKKRVATGFFTNITNPKGILFTAAFLPQWLKPDAPLSLAQQAFVIAVISVVIDACVMHSYSFLASSIRHLLASQSAAKATQIVLGAFLCVLGIFMVISRLLG